MNTVLITSTIILAFILGFGTGIITLALLIKRYDIPYPPPQQKAP